MKKLITVGIVRKKRFRIGLPISIAVIVAVVMLLVMPAKIEITLSGGYLSIHNYTYATNGWLSDWAKRVKLTIDSGDIDAALTWFPVLIKISTSSGYNSEDVSLVFDEIAADANRKKIAVTKADGTTQLYVEIEKWDNGGEEAILWVSRDGWEIASGADTDIYLYYDSSHAENTTYVADSGSRTEVWDANFEAVYHMAEASGNIIDSTDRSNDSDVIDGSPTYEVAGQVGDAITMPGNGGFEVPDVASLDLAGTAQTIEFWFKHPEASNFPVVLNKGGGDEDYVCFIYTGSPPNGVTDGMAYRILDGGDSTIIVTDVQVDDDAWRFCQCRYDGVTQEIWLAGVVNNSKSETNSIATNNQKLTIGMYNTSTALPFNGELDEIRLHSTARADAWLGATYEATRDHLLDWGSEESASDISNTPDNNAFGILEVNTASSTAIDKFRITNNSGGAVSITIQATDLTGGNDTWDLSDDASVGQNIYGLKAGLDDDDDNFDVVVKEDAAYNTLVAGLADSATQDWGLKLYMPSSITDYDAQQMTATVTLVATCD